MKGITTSMARAFAVIAMAALAACAQVPKESVELSTTVGRDISTMHDSHRKLATVLFDRMKQDVNRFVDNVYAPFQIQFTLAKQKERQTNGNKNNIFAVLDTAMKEPQNPAAQKDVIDFMQAMVEFVHEDVEGFRKERLAPILEQEKQVLADIERVYDQIQRGNEIVTAHLASIVKVNEAQDEILRAANLEGLREKIGLGLSKTSEQVSKFVDDARRVEGNIDQVKNNVEALTKTLDEITKGK